jgi:6-phosphofructokinase
MNKGKLYGFKDGNKGIFNKDVLEIDDEIISLYHNQGGYLLLGRNSDSIRGENDYKNVLKTC